MPPLCWARQLGRPYTQSTYNACIIYYYNNNQHEDIDLVFIPSGHTFHFTPQLISVRALLLLLFLTSCLFAPIPLQQGTINDRQTILTKVIPLRRLEKPRIGHPTRW